MPKPSNTAAYPEIYFSIFEQVERTNSYSTPPIKPKEAAALRFDLYGFRSALTKEAYPKARLWGGFKILINSKDEAPLQIISEEEKLTSFLASTLENVEITDEEDYSDLEELEVSLGDSGDALGGLGYGLGAPDERDE